MNAQLFIFYIDTYCCILERIIYLQCVYSTFTSNRVSYCRREYICFTRYISGTNLQILQFAPIMKYQSCFTTSLPGMSPFRNTSLWKRVHMWRDHHIYQPLLNIPFPWRNRSINIIDARFFNVLTEQFCYCPPLGSGSGCRRAGRKQGALHPTSTLQHSQHLLIPWDTLMRTEWGKQHVNPRPPPLQTSTLLRLLLQQPATGCPWVLVPWMPPRGCSHGAAVPELCEDHKSPSYVCSWEAPHGIQRIGAGARGEEGNTSLFCALHA